MELRDTPEQARFRADARAFLRASVPPGWGTPAYAKPRSADERVAFARRWQRTLFEGGYAGLDWPREFGGRGATVSEGLIWGEEYARAQAPNLIQLSVGTSLVGPTLVAHGRDWQRRRFLAPILRGDELWCQGFSEPNAGSDLAALRTRGEVRGSEVVVTGQKIWTSFAQHADWCILIVRTDAGAAKHRGLTFLLVDMGSPGISVRPLREMTGEAWFNEVFFDAVRVPLENVVGEVDRGWDVVVTTLAVERSTSAQHARLEVDLAKLLELARQTSYQGAPASRHPRIRVLLAELSAGVMALRTTAWRNAARLEATGAPGPEGSILKLAWSDLEQRTKEAAIEILGMAGLVPEGDPLAVDEGHWAYELLWSRAATIYAGTSEIQRNIVAERALGLPRAGR
jgi:alkylation response protein AidB-like acyl-CoA dehydrogenase